MWCIHVCKSTKTKSASMLACMFMCVHLSVHVRKRKTVSEEKTDKI